MFVWKGKKQDGFFVATAVRYDNSLPIFSPKNKFERHIWGSCSFKVVNLMSFLKMDAESELL